MNLRIQPLSALPLPASPVDVNATIAQVNRQEFSTPVTVAPGDGIGPEIMKASLDVLLEAGANIAIDQVQIGETLGIGADAWESIRRTRVLFKAPTGGSLKSFNETLRRTLDLFVNVRAYAAYHPFVASEYPGLDLVVIRQNGYSDAENQIDERQRHNIGQLRKVWSRAGYESIARYAFEYAVRNGRRKVFCFTPHNILKQTEGLFHTVFQEVAYNYAGVEHEVWTLTAGAAQLAHDPRRFDLIVLPNVSSDCLAERIAGPVGLLPSVSAGSDFAVFEAAQSATAALAGLDIANPSGMIVAGAMMLRHIGQAEAADRVHDALLTTLEQGTHTSDIFSHRSTEKVGTIAFARAVIRNLGQKPKRLESRCATSIGTLVSGGAEYTRSDFATKRLIGVDVFVRWRGRRAGLLAQDMRAVPNRDLELTMISNRGLQVWPMAAASVQHKSDLWRCRYTARNGRLVDHATIANLLLDLAYLEIDFIKTEHVYGFDEATTPIPPHDESHFSSAGIGVATA